MRIDATKCFILQIDLDQTTNKSTFKRMYIVIVCWSRVLFRVVRKLLVSIGLFWKLSGGSLLVVLKDCNNKMFSIDWTVVEGENQMSWSWFLDILFWDMNIGVDPIATKPNSVSMFYAHIYGQIGRRRALKVRSSCHYFGI